MVALTVFLLGLAQPFDGGKDADDDTSVQDSTVFAAPSEAPIDLDLDSDKDGIPDYLEDRNRDGQVDPGETDPKEPDSDRDGVPDGVEDADGDGKVSPGESDPRVPGLFPGSYPHIPEPMVFDLVRGLGATKGELEINTLVQVPFRRSGVTPDWAPEIEWAPADGFAVELELPMHGGRLHGLKTAIQTTFKRRGPREFIDGLQILGEAFPGGVQTSAIYLIGYRLSRRWSLFGMAGLRLEWQRPFAVQAAALLNPSIFADFGERVTLGVEHQFVFKGTREVPEVFQAAVIPQFHIQMARQWRLQIGGGLALEEGRPHAMGGLRLILEL